MPLADFDPAGHFYWIGAHELAPGSIVKPGNWGQLVRRAGLRHNLAGRELLWEEVRVASAPDRPSRFTAAFVVPLELNLAVTFRNETNPLGRIFEVELATPEANSASADMCWINVVNNNLRDQLAPSSAHAPALDRERGWAERYWASAVFSEENPGWPPPLDSPRTEFLITSALRIVMLVEA